MGQWRNSGKEWHAEDMRQEGVVTANRELEKRLNRKFQENFPSGKLRTKFHHKVMMLIEM